MKKTLLFAILFQFSFLSSFAQINNLSVFLATSEMSEEDLIHELQYKWEFSSPTEKIKDEIIEARYSFNLTYRGYTQVLERKLMVNREYGIKMKTTSLLFNDVQLLDRVKENLPYQGFQLKSTDFNQSLYKNGYHTIILREGVSKDDILAEGFFKLEIYSYREELIDMLLEKRIPDAIPDDATNDALNRILNGADKEDNGKEKEIPLEENKAGGDPSQSYYGVGIDDYIHRLPGRRVLVKQEPSMECNEAGLVVVAIEVDQTGNVTKATAGIKGTTNKNFCLLEQSKRAALATQFNKDLNAPVLHTGTIRYFFKSKE